MYVSTILCMTQEVLLEGILYNSSGENGKRITGNLTTRFMRLVSWKKLFKIMVVEVISMDS